MIPARYASTRFPGKPLATIAGYPLIYHTYMKATVACGLGYVDDVWVLTDDSRIANYARDALQANTLMTPQLANGTERCAWASIQLGLAPEDVVVNVQGDSPLTEPDHISQLASWLQADGATTSVATLVVPVDPRDKPPPGAVFAIMNHRDEALYFSRSVEPFPHAESEGVLHRHIGLYGYRSFALRAYRSWGVGHVESIEQLEQLRWVEHGYRVQCLMAEPSVLHPEVNFPEDAARVEASLRELMAKASRLSSPYYRGPY